MAKTRGAAGAAMTEAPREIDPLPRHGDPLEEVIGEAARDERPGVNDRSAATDEEIARRAYELYQARGGADGADMDDWLQAERELRAGGAGASEYYASASEESDDPVHRPID